MLLVFVLAAALAGQAPSIVDDRERVVRSLQPTQFAELWIENSGEYVGGPDRIGGDQIAFKLWIHDVDVAVVASGCGDAELPDFAACERFKLTARDLSREVDLPGGRTIASIDASLFDLMDHILKTYPPAPRRY